MTRTLATLLMLTMPMAALAQTAAAPAKAPAPAAKAAAPAAKKPAKAATKPKAQSASRTEIKSTATNVAAGIAAAEAALTPAELAIAERVHVGTLPCELGANVTITPDPKAPGYFDVQTKTVRYRMFPVATSTGAIRLEDRRNGAVWLQLGNKSMLMNQRLGQRLADECQSPSQMAVAQSMRTNPAPNLLEPLPAPAATAPVRAAPMGVTPVYPTGPTPPAAK